MLDAVLNACIATFGSAPNLFFGLVIAGLVGGMTHCAAQCGVFVAALSLDDRGDAQLNLSRLTGLDLLPVHIGRLTTYAGLTLLMSAAMGGLNKQAFDTAAPILLAAAGSIFIAAALTGRHGIRPPRALENSINRLQGRGGRYIQGLAMGLVPCAMSVGAIMAASTASSRGAAVLAILCFGAGTTTALLPLPAVIRWLQRHIRPPRWIRPALLSVSGIGLMAIAARTFFKGINYVA